jgi:hypothetical protein
MKLNTFSVSASPGRPGLTAFNAWARGLGIGTTAAWEWRKRNWIDVIDIGGRKYVTDEALRKFYERAVNGEFAKERPAPRRDKAAV